MTCRYNRQRRVSEIHTFGLWLGEPARRFTANLELIEGILNHLSSRIAATLGGVPKIRGTVLGAA